MRKNSKFADSLASKIQKLKRELGNLSQQDLARKLSEQGKEVTQGAVSKLEKGLYAPSAEMLIRLGNLASHPDSVWFYQNAGVETAKFMREMRRKSRDLSAKRQAPPSPTEVVHLPLVDIDEAGGSKLEEAAQEAARSVPLPAALIPNPASTVCVQLDQTYSNPIAHKGTLVIIDGLDTDCWSLFQRLVAVHFDPLPNLLIVEPFTLDEIGPRAATSPFRISDAKDTNSDEIAGLMNRQEGVFAPRAGTLVGWITREGANKPGARVLYELARGEPWRLVLRAASVRGFTSGASPALTDWSAEEWAPRLGWGLPLVKGARILGEVIAWIKPVQAAREQEPK